MMEERTNTRKSCIYGCEFGGFFVPVQSDSIPPVWRRSMGCLSLDMIAVFHRMTDERNTRRRFCFMIGKKDVF